MYTLGTKMILFPIIYFAKEIHNIYYNNCTYFFLNCASHQNDHIIMFKITLA